jgi:conjugal transfer pilin signal peptidase TrbI
MSTAPVLGWWHRCARDGAQWLRHLRCRWYLYGPLLLIWSLAYVRLFIDPTPRVPILVNWTPSLPYHVALMRPRQHPLQRGDLIVFRFDGPAQKRYPGLRGQPFFKRVRGVPGDVITVVQRTVYINGELVGQAKPRAFDGYPLAPIAPMVIPSGHFYVQGTSPDSLDSRYQESGLVRADQVLGVVTPIF